MNMCKLRKNSRKELKSEYIEKHLIKYFEGGFVTITPMGMKELSLLLFLLGSITLVVFSFVIFLFLSADKPMSTTLGLTAMLVPFGLFTLWCMHHSWNKFIITFDCKHKLLGYFNVTENKATDSKMGKVLGFEVSEYKHKRKIEHQISAVCENGSHDLQRFKQSKSAEELKLKLCKLLNVPLELE